MQEMTVRLGDDTATSLRTLARHEGVPVAQIVREAVAVRIAVGPRPSNAAELRRDLDHVDERVERIERALRLRRR